MSHMIIIAQIAFFLLKRLIISVMDDIELGFDVVNEDDCISQAINIAYSGSVPYDLKSGICITIEGCVQSKCLRFAINFMCGRGPLASIAFHFNPRLDQRYVVRNCRIRGEWGDEETTSLAKFNFEQGKKFTIDILICTDKFMVAVDGYHFCGFGYRIPLKEITDMDVHGRVDIESIRFRTINVYPDMVRKGTGHLYQIPIYRFDDDVPKDPENRLPMPFLGYLTAGLQIGWQVEINGRVKVMPHSFYVNLQTGQQVWPHPNIPLHLNPRFSSAIGANSFIRNCWFDGKWHNEERCPTFPFEPGLPFELIIKKEYESIFSVWVNGQMTGEFQPGALVNVIESARIIYVQGDVVLTSCIVRAKGSDTMFENGIPKSLKKIVSIDENELWAN